MSFILALNLWLMATICETSHFHEVHTHVTPETLLVLDIDDTLLVPEQMLGCDEWFQHRLKTHKANGSYDALEQALLEWEAIRHLCKMEVVEADTPKHIATLQSQGVAVMGLTTQRMTLAYRTLQQLKSHGMDLTRTAPCQEDHYFCQQGHGVLYRMGVLFTAGTAKGEALFQLCDRLGITPKRIVFVNDKASHLGDVETTAAARGVEFVGLRYAFSDARKKAFQPEIAEVQFQESRFGRLMSDKEVKSLNVK